RLAPIDVLAPAQFAARIVKHRLAQVGGHQPDRRVEPLAQVARDQAGAAGDFKHRAGGFCREALRHIDGEGVEPGRTEAAVVVLGYRAGETCAHVRHMPSPTIRSRKVWPRAPTWASCTPLSGSPHSGRR